MLICGRYEGVDERVSEMLADEELSIGDYVLSGGELAAAVVLDATARLLPGVLGHADSARYESFGAADAGIGDGGEAKTADGVPRSTARGGRAAGLSALHAAGAVSRGGDSGGARRRATTRRSGDGGEGWQQSSKTWRNRPDLLEFGGAE